LGIASPLNNAVLTGAIIDGANFYDETSRGFTSAQLYSTASYTTDNLVSINLSDNNLTGWNFAGQNLSNSTFTSATLNNANFSDADLRGATGWVPATSTTTNNTILPSGAINGLALGPAEKLVIHNNAIPVTVNSSATFDPAATLQFLLEPGWTSPMEFAAGLTPTLDGTLDLEVDPSVVPGALVGQTFQIFDFSSPLPAGDEFGTILTNPGVNWDLSQLYTTGAVTVEPLPEPASASLVAIGAAALLTRRRSRRKTPSSKGDL
jgi:hypothetical protein